MSVSGSVFYPETRARYDLAKPGTLRLLPHADHRAALEADYAGMAEMLFGPLPPFDSVLDTLAKIERSVNGS